MWGEVRKLFLSFLDFLFWCIFETNLRLFFIFQRNLGPFRIFATSGIVLFVTAFSHGIMSGRFRFWMLWRSWIRFCIRIKNFCNFIVSLKFFLQFSQVSVYSYIYKYNFIFLCFLKQNKYHK